MYTPVVRVLIADDFEAWRIKLRAILEENPALRVVGEARTGLELLQQAQILKPDLLVLDIGLPIISGLEAARILRETGLKAKILFVSENRHWEIAEEALQAGALGYVVKSDAGSDLLPAIDAVHNGKQFISALLKPYVVLSDRDESGKGKKPRSPLPLRKVAIRHQVAFYADDEALETGFARAANAALNAGNTVAVIATGVHQRRIHATLQELGVNLDYKIKHERFIQIDAGEMLQQIITNGIPDLQECKKKLEDILSQTTGRSDGDPERITIFGECAPTLLRQRNVFGAIQLEHIWDEITQARPVDTLCGYIWSAFQETEVFSAFRRLCAEHSAVHDGGLDQ